MGSTLQRQAVEQVVDEPPVGGEQPDALDPGVGLDAEGAVKPDASQFRSFVGTDVRCSRARLAVSVGRRGGVPGEGGRPPVGGGQPGRVPGERRDRMEVLPLGVGEGHGQLYAVGIEAAGDITPGRKARALELAVELADRQGNVQIVIHGQVAVCAADGDGGAGILDEVVEHGGVGDVGEAERAGVVVHQRVVDHRGRGDTAGRESDVRTVDDAVLNPCLGDVPQLHADHALAYQHPADRDLAHLGRQDAGAGRDHSHVLQASPGARREGDTRRRPARVKYRRRHPGAAQGHAWGNRDGAAVGAGGNGNRRPRPRLGQLGNPGLAETAGRQRKGHYERKAKAQRQHDSTPPGLRAARGLKG
ncbi:MAG: hypothetical protein BWZ02_02815 [Lentisphaerae bacterium ADurb.BinA184]|nr:MAG: hypothetical protein BWZ02_02815 [Lentisphaerae bacterium ADurb.BinA184]